MKAHIQFIGACLFLLISSCGGAPSLTSDNAEDRYIAVMHTPVNKKEDLKMILGYASDESKLVRLGVVEKYSRLGTTDYIEQVLPLMDDPSWEVRRMTVRLVCRLKLGGAWSKLVQMSSSDKSDFVKIEIIKGAASIAPPGEAALLLKSLLKDKSPTIRFHAREQLKSVSNN